MPIQILSSPSAPDRTQDELRAAIERAIEGARVEVHAASPGHFEIRVVSERFEGRSRVQQQQAVYAAIAHLMKGEMAPVHAIDRLTTATS
jgi:acid stress-induced BolA-like protein IbaG/YrbA